MILSRSKLISLLSSGYGTQWGRAGKCFSSRSHCSIATAISLPARIVEHDDAIGREVLARNGKALCPHPAIDHDYIEQAFDHLQQHQDQGEGLSPSSR